MSDLPGYDAWKLATPPEHEPPEDEDEEYNAYMADLENCPETCPACGSTDLHSASLNGEDAISCCDCVWIATIASFQPTSCEKP